jgi:UDP-N-acetyl-2-amino-2-deoxyglucuronate dehydrogenase
LDGLADVARRTNRSVNTILQLRLHPAIKALRERVQRDDKIHDVVLTYVASRGRWYHVSWKGDEKKSGGVATNIGVHFFDMLTHVFGAPKRNTLHVRSPERAAGYLELERARVSWFLSIAREDLPASAQGKPTWRSVTIDGQDVEFSDGFTDLHTESYREILAGRGFGIDEVRLSVEIVSALRTMPVEIDKGERHPMAQAMT